jgi:phosphatidylinositol alpha-1,6-mannosyltransferase
MRRIVRRQRVTQAHCSRCIPEGWIALLLKRWCGLPYLCYVHGEEVNLEGDRADGMMASRQLRWMTRAVLRGAAGLIANSHNTAAILRDQWRVPAERVRVLYPGVDTERFRPAGRDPAARGRLGWGDRPVVLTVGRLQRRKGHDLMIRALRTVRAAISDVLYAIVGEGDERPRLERLVAQEGLGQHVQLLGELPDEDLVRCYQQADLFVLPNRQVGLDIEGYGIVLLEAQACGTPVVAGASGGTREALRDPETGRLVACERSEELAATIVALLAEPGRLGRMGAAGRRWVVERFDAAALGRQAERIFLDLMPPAAGDGATAQARRAT